MLFLHPQLPKMSLFCETISVAGHLDEKGSAMCFLTLHAAAMHQRYKYSLTSSTAPFKITSCHQLSLMLALVVIGKQSTASLSTQQCAAAHE